MCTNSTVQGCNLSVQGKNEKLHFLELQDFSAGSKGNSIDHGFCELYKEIRKAVEAARLKETKAGPGLLMHLQHLQDIEIRTASLSTGLAVDVHGQMTVLIHKVLFNDGRTSGRKNWSFQYKVKENSVEFFYPGSRH